MQISEDHTLYAPPALPGTNGKVDKKNSRRQDEGRMAPAGLEMVCIANETGTWDALNDIEAGIIPPDLEEALSAYTGARFHFDQFSRSARRGIQEWIFNAQRTDTLDRPIDKTVRIAQRHLGVYCDKK